MSEEFELKGALPKGMQINEEGVVISYEGDEPTIEIPEGIKGIYLDEYEGFYNDKATTLIIPSTLVSISFMSHFLPNLEKIIVHPDNPVFEVRDGCLLEKETMRVLAGGKGMKIPEGTKIIDPYAFTGSRWVYDVVIPASVVKMDANPFEDCSRLSSIKVARGNEHFYMKNGYLIGKENKIVICGFGKKPLPSGIKMIGSSAFYGCDMGEFEVPEGVEYIGSSAFGYCTKLKKITLPSTLEMMGSTVFFHCHWLEELIIPEGVTSVGRAIVDYCPSLEYISFPSTVMEIEDNYLGATNRDMVVYVHPDNPEYLSTGHGVWIKTI